MRGNPGVSALFSWVNSEVSEEPIRLSFFLMFYNCLYSGVVPMSIDILLVLFLTHLQIDAQLGGWEGRIHILNFFPAVRFSVLFSPYPWIPITRVTQTSGSNHLTSFESHHNPCKSQTTHCTQQGGYFPPPTFFT